MSLFILQNDAGEYLTKSLQWTASGDARDLFKTPHKDVALNQLVEMTARNINLRAHVVSCEADDKGLPRLDRTAGNAA